MTKALTPLLIAQFLSAFADNAILFAVIAMVMQSANPASWYVPALQSVFLVAFVVCAPWVGDLANRVAKSRLLIIANLIKAGGAGLLLLKTEPLLAYSVVGLGAALYSPAKYGILPELTAEHQLVKANSWIEGSTILAILTGMVVGAKVADHSIALALQGTLVLFSVSALMSLFLPATASKASPQGLKLMVFYRETRYFLAHPRSRFAILSASLFWAAAACVRVILVAWAPLVLLSQNASDIANLTLFLALGIIGGSALAPWLIPLQHLRKSRYAAYAMGALIVDLSTCQQIWSAQLVLFLMGCAGGLFIVPINAALQTLGQQSIGSGSAVAMQNFFQNLAMLLAVGGYGYLASLQISPVHALIGLGCLLLIASWLVVLNLPTANETGHQ